MFNAKPMVENLSNIFQGHSLDLWIAEIDSTAEIKSAHIFQIGMRLLDLTPSQRNIEQHKTQKLQTVWCSPSESEMWKLPRYCRPNKCMSSDYPLDQR